jgi:hypothetical protein
MRRGKVFVLIIVFLVFSAVFSEARNRRRVVSAIGGLHRLFPYGSVEEYAAGENDFPVTPAHTPVLAGLSYAVLGRLGFEIEARFVGSSRVVLSDPSDGDSIVVATAPRAGLSLNFLVQPFFGRIRPFLLAGGGVDIVLSEEAVYTSKYGYAITVPAPRGKERFDPEIHAGGGFLINIAKRWGLRLETRYVWILDVPKSVRGLQAAAGLSYDF